MDEKDKDNAHNNDKKSNDDINLILVIFKLFKCFCFFLFFG